MQGVNAVFLCSAWGRFWWLLIYNNALVILTLRNHFSLAMQQMEYHSGRLVQKGYPEDFNARGFKPHPLFGFFNADCGNHNFQLRAAFDNCLNDSLPRSTFMHIRDQLAAYLNSVGLKTRQKLKPGKTCPKMVYRHTDPRSLEWLHGLRERIKARNNFTFGKLYNDLFRH